MDKQFFVQNIKRHCERLGISPAEAFRRCGIGKNFINSIVSRDQTPGFDKVEQLAAFFETTIGELTGEKIPTPKGGQIPGYDDLTPAEQARVDEYVALLFAARQTD